MQGGQLKITHGDTPKMVDFSQNSDYKTCAVAFYADCQHELLRVTSGYRLCLIYNLVHVGQGAPPAAIDRTAAVQALCPILERWAADDNGPKKLVWLLEHRYSQAGLKSVASLKAQDRAVADTLWAAAKAAGADVYLATFVRREQGPAEGGYAGIPSTFVEVDSYSHYCKDWVSLDGQRLTFKQMPVEGDKEFIRDGLNSERLAFEKEEINEATGNAGARMDRWYNQAALVVWPRKHRVANLMRGSATALAQELRAALLRDPASAAATLKEVVAQLCTVEVDAAALKGVQEVILAAQAEECAQQFVSGALPKFLREQQYKDDAKRAAAAIDLAAPLYTRFISPAMFQSMQTLTKTLLKKYRVVQPLLELLLLVAQTPCAGEAQKFPFETRELQHMMVHVLDIVEREAVAFSRFQPDEWYYMLPAAAGSATVTALLVALSKCLLRGCQASSATADE
ncbi:hypothetical protein WJX72_008916 [[Myrmecia] bisecta]|uniref:Uncharacterized protein n=1 Tax=[Myrmecia] bisecta TaxID=41462 RepID=A0AAW1PGQ3_9CHLO